MPEKVKVLIVDDYALVRNGIRMAVAGDPMIDVVAEADSGQRAIQVAKCLRPDVILMDVSMPQGISGLDASRTILTDPDLCDTKIVILSVFIDDDTVFEALRSGVRGYLLKDTAPDKIVETIHIVVNGGSVLSPDLAARVISEFARRPTVNKLNDAGLTRLTGRELDVFKLLVCGYHNDEIADMLVVAESTVKSHVQRLYDKLGVRDRVQVVIYAYEHGLVDASQAKLRV